MLKIFKKNLNSEYKERITKSFPKKLHSDLKEVLKILALLLSLVCNGKNPADFSATKPYTNSLAASKKTMDKTE